VDYPVSNFLFTRQLGPVNHRKKAIVDNIGPNTLVSSFSGMADEFGNGQGLAIIREYFVCQLSCNN
jgi:hypothetical protein